MLELVSVVSIVPVVPVASGVSPGRGGFAVYVVEERLAGLLLPGLNLAALSRDRAIRAVALEARLLALPLALLGAHEKALEKTPLLAVMKATNLPIPIAAFLM